MAYQYQNKVKFPSLLDALYCDEEEEQYSISEDDDEQSSQCVNEGDDESDESPSLLLLEEEEWLWGEEELCILFKKEQDYDFGNNNGFSGLNLNPSLLVVEARCNAVGWMLKVVGFYSFSAKTALLAVNFLDRFLFSSQSHNDGRPWMFQLAAVACLSLAAKVEETQVPLLLDFQVEESKYVFEAKTIQRMEMLVLSTLQWKMNPVTPLSFLEFMMRRLRLKNHMYWEFLRRCECLLLFIISDCRFLSYLPSVMATATMLHIVSNVEPCLTVEYQDQLLGILGINKDKVEDCLRLISEVASNLNFYSSNKRKFRSLPGSPKGVMDLSFSSESSNDSWSFAASSVSSSPEPLSKKNRGSK
ncbi:OLC1v1016851C1 [Oldenlandia corymbosa var. corymbosa]|uniref:OLC1v1016851C1 n=1 Tax=Oldenlandia corymbosa var. corymbosa TaxID=529605 RepID=A0AAV1E840_OLDCO|nr:OLC1v1016851C1 [Oldenlandia corymbosa var. corymbosa]